MSEELNEWKANARRHERRARRWRAVLVNVRVLIQNGQLGKALEILEELRPAVEAAEREEEQGRALGHNPKES